MTPKEMKDYCEQAMKEIESAMKIQVDVCNGAGNSYLNDAWNILNHALKKILADE